MIMLGNIATPPTNATIAPDDNHNEIIAEIQKEDTLPGTDSLTEERDTTVPKQEESSDEAADEDQDGAPSSRSKVIILIFSPSVMIFCILIPTHLYCPKWFSDPAT
nr:unnamed protein product [Callosobruchus analis]